jgi:hypothetical protein
MVRVDVESRLVVTCGHSVLEGEWDARHKRPRMVGYYYFHSPVDPFTVSGIPAFQPNLYISRIKQHNANPEIRFRNVVLRIKPLYGQMELWEMPDYDATYTEPLHLEHSITSMEIFEDSKWIPFPVKIVSSVQLK